MFEFYESEFYNLIKAWDDGDSRLISENIYRDRRTARSRNFSQQTPLRSEDPNCNKLGFQEAEDASTSIEVDIFK